jgi:XTP/dITP diphosphohydrolase
MQSKLLFVTDKTPVFNQVQSFFKAHAPHIELVQKVPEWHELQSLEEERVIEHKTLKAWQHYRTPLLVEDTGFYFKRYPDYPGTLSEFALSGLAREGLSKLCRVDNAATAFCWIGYIGQSNADCYFRDHSDGYIMDEFAPETQTDISLDLVFHPEGASKTLQELVAHEKEALVSPRLKACRKFLDWYNNDGRQE